MQIDVLPVCGVIGLIALRQGAEQTRDLAPHLLVQALAGAVGAAAQQNRHAE